MVMEAAPVWPVGLLALFLVLVVLSAPGDRSHGTIPGLLGFSAAVFALSHWTSFRDFVPQLRSRSLSARIADLPWRRMWPFLLYGAAMGVLTVHVYPMRNSENGFLLNLCLIPTVGLAGFLAALSWTRWERRAYRLGASVAALTAWLVMVAGWSLHPAWLPDPNQSNMLAVELSTVLATVLFAAEAGVAQVTRGARPDA